MEKNRKISLGVVGLVALTVFGCGGKKDNPANPAAPPPTANNVPPGTYPPGTYPPGTVPGPTGSQGYFCQNGAIQLRSRYGGPARCYGTADLATACAQAGGMLHQNGLCRQERIVPVRQFGGSFRGPIDFPLSIGIAPGESVRLEGTALTRYSDCDWNLQLLSQGMVVGGISNQTVGPDGEFVLTSYSNLAATTLPAYSGTVVNGQPTPGYPNAQYPNAQYPNAQYPNAQYPNAQYPNAQYPGYATQYPAGYANPGAASGYYGQPAYGQPAYGGVNVQVGVELGGQYGGNYGYGQMLRLQGYSRDKLSLRILRAVAVSCEDGRGNSYLCP